MLRVGSMLVLALLAAAGGGCSTSPTNAAFDVHVQAASALIDELERTPRPLPRPLLILGGWFDPGLVTNQLRGTFARAFDTDEIATCAFPFAGSFDECREKAIRTVDQRFPCDDPTWTTEVDVVAVSMGGLVARYAAAEHGEGRRLRIRNLFTIATPHRGAAMAGVPTLDLLVVDMRPGSAFLDALDRRLPEARYSLIPYVRLGDAVVGPENAAPPGEAPWWVPNRPFEASHLAASKDPRILADIMLRLREEPHYTSEPRTPVPEG